MYQKKYHNWFKHLDFIVLDLLCMQISYILAFMLRHGRYLPYVEEQYRIMAPIIFLVGIIFAVGTHNYSGILKRGYYREFFATFKYVSAVIVGTFTYMFLVQESGKYSRVMFVVMWAIDIIISWIVRIIYKKCILKNISKRLGRRSVVVVTNIKNAETVIARLKEHRLEDIRLTGLLLVDNDSTLESVLEVPVVGGKDDILTYLMGNWVDEVFISLNDTLEEYKYSEKLVSKCMEMGLTVHTKLTRTEDFLANQVVEKFAGYTVISSSIAMVTPGQLIAKRILDIAGGIVGCLITMVVTIIVGPIIFIKSPGPIFFNQVRVGKNGKTFKIYKFRSMYLDAEKRKKELMEQNKMSDGMMFKMDNDPRIIKGIGPFIRKYSIDELPQFWNILIGDMSLVGTRPPTVDEWEKYKLHHRKRLAIKPGLTGMWQVSGRSNIVDFEKVVELDAKYIAEWNFGLDIKIILKTIKVVLAKEGSV